MNDPFILSIMSSWLQSKVCCKTAEPVLPKLKPEEARPLQSTMPKQKSHAWMQCHPNATGCISGPQATLSAVHCVRWRNMGLVLQLKLLLRRTGE